MFSEVSLQLFFTVIQRFCSLRLVVVKYYRETWVYKMFFYYKVSKKAVKLSYIMITKDKLSRKKCQVSINLFIFLGFFLNYLVVVLI